MADATITIRDRVQELELNLSPDLCICKFDEEFTPRRIGLGLFHHDDRSNDVVEFKMPALRRTVFQMPGMDETRFIEEVARLLPSIQDCYVRRHPYSRLQLSPPSEQARAFAMDACFVLQFLTHGIPGIINDVRNDMMQDIFTFQNQIPLFLLFKIMQWKFNGDRVRAATAFAEALTQRRPFRYLSPLALSAGEDIIRFLLLAEGERRSHHLLHLLHKSIAHFLQQDEQYTVGGIINPMRHNVLESLDTYNIKFRARNAKILFKKKLLPSSTLYLPQINLDGDTFPVHRSLMQFGMVSRNYNLICDLTCLMKCIAVLEGNETRLRAEGIIQGIRGEHRFSYSLSNLCDGVTDWHGGVYRTVIDQLDEHSKFFPNRWIFNIRQFIFNYGFFGLFFAVLFGILATVLK